MVFHLIHYKINNYSIQQIFHLLVLKPICLRKRELIHLLIQRNIFNYLNKKKQIISYLIHSIFQTLALIKWHKKTCYSNWTLSSRRHLERELAFNQLKEEIVIFLIIWTKRYLLIENHHKYKERIHKIRVHLLLIN